MPPAHGYAPDLQSYLGSLKTHSLETSIETLIALLKRRQIKSSKPCAIATAHLLLKVVAKFRWTDVNRLIDRIKSIGRRLVDAQPRETVVANIVRRILGMIRDEAREDRNEDASDSTPNSQAGSPWRGRNTGRSDGSDANLGTVSPIRVDSRSAESLEKFNTDIAGPRTYNPRPPLITSHTSFAVANGQPVQHSMFNLLSATTSPASTPTQLDSPHSRTFSTAALARGISQSTKDLKAEIIGGIEEIIDELDQVEDQVASYAQEHIHSGEVILTHTASRTVQKFLLKAAERRKFTVIYAESFPNEHAITHSAIVGGHASDPARNSTSFQKSLTAAGITVIMITDAAIFAIMSRVNKVILATHAVIANGGLVAAAGARIVARAAKVHRTPVIVVSGVYKLSPEYPFDFESLIEYGDPSNVVAFEEGPMVEELQIDNPVYDYVPADLIDLYITNLGAHAPSYLYRIVADHYKPEDINFNKLELQT